MNTKENTFGYVAMNDDSLLLAKGNSRLEAYAKELSRQLVKSTRPTAAEQYREPKLDCYRCMTATKFNGQHLRGRCQLCGGTGKVVNQYHYDGTLASALDIMRTAAAHPKHIKQEDRPIFLPVYLYTYLRDGESYKVVTTDPSLGWTQVGEVGVVFCSYAEAAAHLGVSDRARYLHKSKKEQLDKEMWIYKEL